MPKKPEGLVNKEFLFFQKGFWQQFGNIEMIL